jgi:hypothetical protein
MKEKYDCTPILHIIIDGFGGWGPEMTALHALGLLSPSPITEKLNVALETNRRT